MHCPVLAGDACEFIADVESDEFAVFGESGGHHQCAVTDECSDFKNAFGSRDGYEGIEKVPNGAARHHSSGWSCLRIIGDGVENAVGDGGVGLGIVGDFCF